MFPVVGNFQEHLRECRRHFLAGMQFAGSCSELYFARCYAPKWTGTFASESKVMGLF